jgi:hypothetical protein
MRSLATRTSLLVALILSVASLAGAADRGTEAEAKSMLDKAAEHFKTVGRERALADFTAGKPPFRDRDLYVLCVDSKHVIVANGGYASYVGSSADAFLDANGAPVGRALWNAAATRPSGSVPYPHFNPVTKKPEDKTTFYRKLADDLLCGVGVYSAR